MVASLHAPAYAHRDDTQTPSRLSPCRARYGSVAIKFQGHPRLTLSPAQIKTTASTIQNRNNQRLARARRKELIDDLQKRLHEYERRGVEASLEMQQAARLVTLENQRLRHLLAARGVSQHEITAHLSAYDTSSDGAEAGPGSIPSAWNHRCSATGHAVDTSKTAAGPTPSTFNHLHSPPTTAVPSPDPTPLGYASPYPASSGLEASDYRMMEARQEPGQGHAPPLFHDMQGQDASGTLPSMSDFYCDPMSPASVSDSASSPEMSCLEAAGILAGISQNADSASHQLLLGCIGNEDCTISSARVFQLMVDLG